MFKFILSAIVFFVYGFTLWFSLIFAFSMENYNKIAEKLNASLFSYNITTVLDIKITFVDDWFIRNNRVIGIVMAIASLFVLKLGLDLLLI